MLTGKLHELLQLESIKITFSRSLVFLEASSIGWPFIACGCVVAADVTPKIFQILKEKGVNVLGNMGNLGEFTILAK